MDLKEFEDDEDDIVADSTPVGTITPKTLDKAMIKSLAAEGDSYIDSDIVHVEHAIGLFLNSEFEKAFQYLQSKYCKTLYFTLGFAVLACLKCIMTFDESDIKEAVSALENTIQISSILKKDTGLVGSLSSMFLGNKHVKDGSNLRTMTKLERHAELCHAEAYLIKAQLSLMLDTNMVAFVREGLKIRTAFNNYKSYYKFLRNIHREFGNEGFKKFHVDEHFVSGVLFGLGLFNLIFSMLPSKILRLFEMIGFSGSRQFAISALETAARWEFKDRSQMYPPPSKKKALDKIMITVIFTID